jgi:proteasome lid subunit RPN8/RPN11
MSIDSFYSDQLPERVGFILTDGSVVEVENVAPKKLAKHQFAVSAEDLVRYEDTAVATWHTHPGTTGNLTYEDMLSFKSWPDLTHYIVGNDGVWTFRVEDGEVVRE